jgi:transcriptional regulator with XRE-family HTH domain
VKKGVRPEPGSSETPVVKAGVSDSLDVHVGQQLRRRRLALKIRLKKFSKDAGVSQKQIQRFESGENRTIARRLFDSGILFRGYGEPLRKSAYRRASHEEAAFAMGHATRESMALLRAFQKVESQPVRQDVLCMILDLEGM